MIRYYSTSGSKDLFNLEDAVLQGLAPDGGLFFPDSLPLLPKNFFDSSYHTLSNEEIAAAVLAPFIKGTSAESDLPDIVSTAFNFPAPVVMLSEHLAVLELFHGPTLAFKDFGARFMAALMEKFTSRNNKETVIIVATSGDTGSAVASGFFNKQGIKVCIVFPRNKVSALQEKQLTTPGGNVTAVEIDGTFDDCQRLVKQAFRDTQLNGTINFSSANSINIGRLLPQMVYYFFAYNQVMQTAQHPEIIVPSGNLGNIFAGMLAREIGLPLGKITAANNANASFAEFLRTGVFTPGETIPTYSNAMDVGNPSNFARIQEMYKNKPEVLRQLVAGTSVTDEETLAAIRDLFSTYNYLADPHCATGYAALSHFRPDEQMVLKIILHTAHPAKFGDVIQKAIGKEPEIPERLAHCLSLPSNKISLTNNYAAFADFLKNHY